MSFRTPSTTQQRQTLLDLERTKERLALNQARIGSGKRITRPGDDPTAAALILAFENSIKANAQFLKQADSALSFLKSSEDAVSTAINDTIRLQELAQQGLTSTNGANGRAAMAQEVDALRTNLLALANTREQGKYLFAGTQTQTVPFVDAAPPAGPITYAGDAGIIGLDVTASSSVSTNVPGSTVFFGGGGQGSATDLFQAVTDLRDGLATNNTALIQTAATSLKAIMDNLNQVQAGLGGRQAGLLDLKDTLSGFNVTLQGLQNTQQDTDYAQAVTEFNSDQTAQSAALSTLAKSTRTNLFDYLG
ncbi:MAG: flagellar hook-associated protein FlgL [Geothrix sp.]|nr:flagellar hook-associated protein FlgL [Geothrix sp.]